MTNDTLASAKLKRVCLFRTSQYECLTSYPSEIISRQALSGPSSLTSLTAVTHNLLPGLYFLCISPHDQGQLTSSARVGQR